MDIYLRKRKQRPSLVFVAAVLCGLLLGVGACYAIFMTRGVPGGTQVASTGSPPEGPGEPAAPSPTPTAPASKGAPAGPAGEGTQATASKPPRTELEQLEDLWAARHLYVGISGTKLDDATRAMLSELKPGGIVLREQNVENKTQTIALIKTIKDAVGLGKEIDSLPLIAVAEEGGGRNALNLPESDAPSAEKIGARRDLEYARGAGLYVGQACAARGIGVVLAPVLDVYSAKAPDDLRQRSFGDDYQLVDAVGLTFAQGLMEGRVIPVAKHFPGLGDADGDGHETLASIPASVSAAAVIFPFNEAVTHDIPGLIVGHIAVPELDKDNPERPASLSPKLVEGLLRNTWKFAGVILADDLSAPAITKQHSLEEAAVLALAVGCDAALMLDVNPDQIRMVAKAIGEAAAQGRLDKGRLSQSKKRLDVWQQWLRKPVPGLKGALPELPPVKTAATETAGEQAPAAPQTETPQPPARPIYKVASGDSLYAIATKYKATVADIQKWNNLKGTLLRTGQELFVGPPVPATAPPPAPPKPAQEPPKEEPKAASPPPAETPPAARAQPPNTKKVVYKIKPGDTLRKIADQFHVTYQDIQKWNNRNSNLLFVGQELVLYPPQENAAAPAAPASAPPPPAEIKYTVKSGDFLGKIADTYGVTVQNLMDWNGLKSINIFVGQELIIKKN